MTPPATRRKQSRESAIGAAMDVVHIEFFVEPFSEGAPGPHVEAAVAAFADLGLETEVGPFATTADTRSRGGAHCEMDTIRFALPGFGRLSAVHHQADTIRRCFKLRFIARNGRF